MPRPGGSKPTHELHKAPQQLAAIEDDHRAADLVDDVQDLFVEPASQQGYHRGQGQEPQDGGAAEAEDKGQIAALGQAGPEGPQHHGAVDEGLGIHPGHHKGGGEQTPKGHVHVLAALQGGLGSQQPHADPDDDEAAQTQDDLLKPGQGLHQGAGAQEAGNTQGHVPQDHDQGGEIDPSPLLSQGAVDDEQILQADGGHIRKAHGQALKINVHLLFTPFSLSDTIVAQSRKKASTQKELTRSGGAYHVPLRLPLYGEMSAALGHEPHRRQVEGADPVLRGQCREHPLQHPAGKVGRHQQHGAGGGSAGAGAGRIDPAPGVSGGAGAGGVQPHGALPAAAAGAGIPVRLGRGGNGQRGGRASGIE